MRTGMLNTVFYRLLIALRLAISIVLSLLPLGIAVGSLCFGLMQGKPLLQKTGGVLLAIMLLSCGRRGFQDAIRSRGATPQNRHVILVIVPVVAFYSVLLGYLRMLQNAHNSKMLGICFDKEQRLNYIILQTTNMESTRNRRRMVNIAVTDRNPPISRMLAIQKFEHLNRGYADMEYRIVALFSNMGANTHSLAFFPAEVKKPPSSYEIRRMAADHIADPKLASETLAAISNMSEEAMNTSGNSIRTQRKGA